MGLFIKNHVKSDTPLINWQNNNQNVDQTSVFIQSGVNSIFGLLTNIAEGKGGDDDVDTSKKNDKTIKSLEKELNNILSQCNVSDVSELDEYYKNKEIKINDDICEMYEKYIEIYDKSTDPLSLDIKDLEAQKSKTTDKDELQKINMQIVAAKKLRQETKEEAEKIYNDTKTEILKNLQTIKLEVERAKSLAKKIDTLKNSSDYTSTESADIKEQVSDYTSFNDARLDFLQKPTQTNLDKLKKAYENFDNISSNKSVTQAYNLLKDKYQTVERKGKTVTLDWN